jgi:gluconate 2-dehydrogenase gamma chain
MQRRTLLKWMAAAPLAGTFPSLALAMPKTPIWQTIEALQQHLFPGGAGVPSARSVAAAEYLYMTMRHESFDFEIRDFIFLGVQWAEQEAQTLFGRSFQTLESDECERICRILQNEYARGEAWLSTLISYTLEAFLGDPIYGGNIDEAGWKWLGHLPGAPRPVKRFVYGL